MMNTRWSGSRPTGHETPTGRGRVNLTNGPIDPLVGPRYRLEGKVVTMDSSFHVLDRGVVYVAAGEIAAVQPTEAAPPPGFELSPLVRSGGTIYPGLIELHNHLSYDVLPLWDVPQQFSNRAQWGSLAEYRKLVTAEYDVPGGPLWRAAASEVRLVLETRLGLAAKK